MDGKRGPMISAECSLGMNEVNRQRRSKVSPEMPHRLQQGPPCDADRDSPYQVEA